MLCCKNWLGELNSSKNVSRIICTHISEKSRWTTNSSWTWAELLTENQLTFYCPFAFVIFAFLMILWFLNGAIITHIHNQEYISLHITAFTAHAKHKFLLYLDLDGGKFRMCACLLIWCLSQLVVSPTISLPRAVGRSENPRGASNNVM